MIHGVPCLPGHQRPLRRDADFPPESTAPHKIAVVTPDAFLLDQLDLHPLMVQRALVRQVTEANRPPLTMGQLLSSLARAGVTTFAEEVRRHEFH